MKKRFIRFWEQIDSLDDKIYYSTMFVGCIATFLAFITGLAQSISVVAISTTLIASGWMLIMLIVGIARPKLLPVCRVVLIVVLNFFLLPPAYFVCGGLTSGMPLFFLVSLFLTAVLLRGRTRMILLVASLFVLAFSMHIGWYHPDLVLQLTPRQEYEDVMMTFCTTGIALGMMTIGILNAYNAERKKREALMEQLSELSIRDPLSGLYNRRELFRRLDALYEINPERGEPLVPEGCYLVMYDVDNFKRLNDTYGHQFGDTVLSTIAHTICAETKAERGEFAARYGGEEFICLLCAASAGEAFSRADGIRRAIAALSWADATGLTITVSGGLIACRSRASLSLAIQSVDDLLYKAKHAGKNRIATDEVI
ncbi:MAG: GGDEF domain-containing protein [Oscillospiraceae bacterium]|nr:GGDEF domain-containing protein [Oscillospiraceae bacterium]